MKTVKQIISIALIVAIISLFAVSAYAASSITLGDVTFGEYTDEYGDLDDAYVKIKMNFTAIEGTEQISVLLTTENITSIAEADVAKIIYIEQIDTPENGQFEFSVEKARIKAATGLDDITGCPLYLKVGGTDSEEAATKVITFEESTPTEVSGDVTGDRTIDLGDAIQILRYESGFRAFTDAQLSVADVNGDGEVDVGDAVRILRYEAGLISSLR